MLRKEDFVIIDTETNSLWNPQTIHVICTRTFEGEVREFRKPTRPEVRQELFEYLQRFPRHCGHNFIQYDLLRVFDRLLPGHPIRLETITDTLVVSRLLHYGRKGGHSIRQYGEEFGVKKEGQGIEQWDVLTEEMVQRCHSDTLINLKILEKYWKYIGSTDWESSLGLEHYTAYACGLMSLNGFAFDKDGALRLKETIQNLLRPIDEALATAFPPRPELRREVTPRVTQHGTFNLNDFKWYGHKDLSIFNGGPFSIINWKEFNAGSPKEVVRRLNEAGWRPTEKTKGHIEALKKRGKERNEEKIREYAEFGWKISEENLKTLPSSAPKAAFDIAKRIVLQSRLSDLDEWLALAKPDHVTEGVAVYGDFNPIGAWTHRLSHSRPNLANVPVAKRSSKDTSFETLVNDFNDRMRGLWKARKGFRLLGTDADGIQMRIFCHYVQDEDLREALLTGSKEDGTDIHTLHKKKLGEEAKSRDAAKTFIYAWLLGAGNGKVGEILETTPSKAKGAVENFIESYPGLKELKKTIIPNDAARGYFVGLDGRKVVCDSEHLMLAGYLQNGEAVIMKMAGRIWQERLRKEGIPYRMVTWPHDEWQVEIEDDQELAKYVTDIQLAAFVTVGEELDMFCPLAGTTTIQKDGFIGGYTWKETH